MRLVTFLVAAFVALTAQANILTSKTQVAEFRCQMSTPTGVTTLAFQENDQDEVFAQKFMFKTPSYALNNVGSADLPSDYTYMALTGGVLPPNHYVSVVFPTKLSSGTYTSLSGTVFYVVGNGNVFNPYPLGASPIGYIYCSSFVVK